MEIVGDSREDSIVRFASSCIYYIACSSILQLKRLSEMKCKCWFSEIQRLIDVRTQEVIFLSFSYVCRYVLVWGVNIACLDMYMYWKKLSMYYVWYMCVYVCILFWFWMDFGIVRHVFPIHNACHPMLWAIHYIRAWYGATSSLSSPSSNHNTNLFIRILCTFPLPQHLCEHIPYCPHHPKFWVFYTGNA